MAAAIMNLSLGLEICTLLTPAYFLLVGGIANTMKVTLNSAPTPSYCKALIGQIIKLVRVSSRPCILTAASQARSPCWAGFVLDGGRVHTLRHQRQLPAQQQHRRHHRQSREPAHHGVSRRYSRRSATTVDPCCLPPDAHTVSISASSLALTLASLHLQVPVSRRQSGRTPTWP